MPRLPIMSQMALLCHLLNKQMMIVQMVQFHKWTSMMRLTRMIHFQSGGHVVQQKPCSFILFAVSYANICCTVQIKSGGQRLAAMTSRQWWSPFANHVLLFKRWVRLTYLMMDIGGVNMARKWSEAIQIPGMYNFHDQAYSCKIYLFLILFYVC